MFQLPQPFRRLIAPFTILSLLLITACGSVTVNCDNDHDKASDMALAPIADMAAPSSDMIQPPVDMKSVGTFTAVHSPRVPLPLNVLFGQTNVKGDQMDWSALGAGFRVTGLSFKADMTGGFVGYEWKFIDGKGLQIGSTLSTITNGVWNNMSALNYPVADGSKPVITTYLDVATGAAGEARLSYRIDAINLVTGEVVSIPVTGSVIKVVAIKDVLIGTRAGAPMENVTAGQSYVRDSINFIASNLSDVLVTNFNVTMAGTGGFVAKNLKFVDNATGAQIGSAVPTVMSGTAYKFTAPLPYTIRAGLTNRFTLQYDVGAGVPAGAIAVFTYVADGQVKDTSQVVSSTSFVGTIFNVK